MIGRAVNFVIEWDWTAVYALMVWTGVLLALAWTILMPNDPANADLPEWDLRLRRTGVLVMVAGFLLTVLFGGDQGWKPWPPMLVIALGFDFYLAAAIFTAKRRARLCGHLLDAGQRKSPIPH